MKKVLALALAAMMVLALCGTAFADDPAYDTSVSVSGLATGDTVKFYKVIEWVGETTDHSDMSGWKALSQYSSVLTKDKLTEILVDNPNATPPVASTGITSTLANALADLAGADGVDPTTIATGTATLNVTAPGMWMALITSADAKTIYNPVFVSSDYTAGGNSVDPNSSTLNTGVAKKSTITLEKTAENTSDYNGDHAQTTAVGDVVTFTVTTTIPAYADVYDSPHFVIKDTLTDLALDTGSVTVTAPTGLTKGTEYTVDATTAGYTLTFDPTYLQTIKTATSVTITYTAEVTSTALKAINEETNDVVLEFSHDPTNEDDYDLLKDTTQHYTFSLDAEGLGNHQSVEGLKTSELVKIGLDAAGNPILDRTETSDITGTQTWTGPLAGAEFGLWKTDDASCSGTPYKTQTTGADGRMNFAGLDAGTYYLKEISAPAGYVTNTSIHTIVLAVETDTVTVTEWWNGSAWVSSDPGNGAKSVTYVTEILKSYTVSVDGTVKDTYTFTNESTANDNEIKWTTIDKGEQPHAFENIKGVELPSTGGIGTTIFYIAGLMMVLGAGTVLVARRKADEE